ncbi:MULTISPECIES: nucleotidyl transferase AbiEii/AbiGii toxin family protein [unclassified Ectothiorhodospira]|uniref:nucleotidyl transferase AbiEii/AbiGii toxin family protein n=1 Tax=unclassified Ectothiorhodospira TaxID=2684909 RepID=UPI001EE7E223|nr:MULTISPECIES: nucleotidyl transferase AbiEii/AbiGii toxin family protein [unclassified Ectothiorhodospira]MCG5516969.1 nucleotidyl transferase AbiEii/AbiGii toxin family protein [Ectothiorhodospira sp. 9100]MCG5517498.1 nucleotidyl transferase AbiEii/AbiGii toxin family protein [Ectothiorhodospira sp. 9905]
MNSWDKRYSDRVQLLVDILPVLAKETRFALKGGTAINLFEHDLPRLSVDIDLTWLPVQDFEADVAAISAALEQLAETLRARPLQLQVQTSGGANTGGITRLICSRGRARVQIETTPVMRGAVHPVRTMVVQPEVEQAFGATRWRCASRKARSQPIHSSRAANCSAEAANPSAPSQPCAEPIR